MTVTRVEAYRYAGKLYESQADAERAEARDNLKDFLADHSVGQGGEWDLEMFLDFLCTHYEKLGWLLQKLP